MPRDVPDGKTVLACPVFDSLKQVLEFLEQVPEAEEAQLKSYENALKWLWENVEEKQTESGENNITKWV